MPDSKALVILGSVALSLLLGVYGAALRSKIVTLMLPNVLKRFRSYLWVSSIVAFACLVIMNGVIRIFWPQAGLEVLVLGTWVLVTTATGFLVLKDQTESREANYWKNAAELQRKAEYLMNPDRPDGLFRRLGIAKYISERTSDFRETTEMDKAISELARLAQERSFYDPISAKGQSLNQCCCVFVYAAMRFAKYGMPGKVSNIVWTTISHLTVARMSNGVLEGLDAFELERSLEQYFVELREIDKNVDDSVRHFGLIPSHQFVEVLAKWFGTDKIGRGDVSNGGLLDVLRQYHVRAYREILPEQIRLFSE